MLTKKIKRALTENERKALIEYELISGFELLNVDDFERGRIDALELLAANLDWFEMVAADVSNIRITDA